MANFRSPVPYFAIWTIFEMEDFVPEIFVPGFRSWWDRKYDLKRPPEYKTEDKGDSFKDFINRHCGGEENLFQPVNGQSALEYAGLNGAESIGQSLSGIQRNIFKF